MKRFDQINMIPFIDIMLVLLAIVLTTANFVSKGLIEVDLPRAGQVTETTAEQETPLEIAVNEQGELFFAEEKIEFTQFAEKLATTAKDQLIVLRIDKDAAFEQFIRLLDPLKAGQFTNLSIQAEQEG